jgi:formylglycine-generating enzyme required for sulfatase activity
VDTSGPIIPGEGARISAIDLVSLAGGAFLMGNDESYGNAQDGEGPVHEVRLSPFSISRYAISNAQFRSFVEATDHRTEAEVFGWSFVFAAFLPGDLLTRGVAGAQWWRQVEGADWAHPEGPASDVASRTDHPVVHVSWDDALAFCRWSDTRLPTEAEWEYAARGSLVQQRFPWGDELEPDGGHRMNVFQGTFPAQNAAADGFAGTAPVEAFAPNGFGLHQMTGNVWEWTADWFDPGYYARSPHEDPPGSATGAARVMRGGSYLCHASYCNRYRVDARSSNTPDSSTGNLGFRVANDEREQR